MKAAVIGSGPGGYLAALQLAAAGVEVDLFEKNEIGGVCLNRGCVPTKHLLAYGKTYQKGLSYGFSIEGASFEAAVSFALKGASFFRESVARLLKKSGVNVVKAEAKLYPGRRVEANGTNAVYDAVVVAVGSRPAVPEPFSGLPVITGEDFTEFRRARRVAVVGAGAQGIEIASFYRLLGAEVHLIEVLPQLLPALPARVAGLYESRLKKNGIAIHKGKRVVEADYSSSLFRLKFEDGSELEGIEQLIIAAGRQPATETILVPEIKDNRGFLIVDSYFETPEKGVYAVGDCIRTPALAYTAYAEAETCAANILGSKKVLNYDHLPYAVFGWPEIAWTGRLEGNEIRVQAGVSARAMAENEQDGFVILYEGKDGLSGGVIVGLEAAEIIHMVEGILIGQKIEHFYFIHPTLTEVLGEALIRLSGRKRHG